VASGLAHKSGQAGKTNPSRYYWHDLVGMQVYNSEQTLIGSVARVFNTGANDVLVVHGLADGREHFIPFVLERHILQVQLQERKIVVDWDFDI
jgi:16S rRNA processing protein RimM